MKRKKNDVIVRRKYKVVGITNLHNLPEKENKKMANSHSRVTKVRFTIITYRKGLTKQKKISLSTYEKKKKIHDEKNPHPRKLLSFQLRKFN